MKVFRMIVTNFWDDPRVLEWTFIQKSFFMYLLTNSSTQQCGVYELSMKKVIYQTSLSEAEINELLDFLVAEGRIIFHEDKYEMAIVNWLKYNNCRSPKVAVVVDKELKNIRTREFQQLVIDKCQEFGYPIKTTEPNSTSVPIPYAYPINRVSQSEPEQNQNHNHNHNQQAAPVSPAKTAAQPAASLAAPVEELSDLSTNLSEPETAAIDTPMPQTPVSPTAQQDEPYQMYQENFGPLSVVNKNDLAMWAQKLNPELVCEALRRAALKQEKYPYAVGIMRKWVDSSIRTMEDVAADDERFKQQRQGRINRTTAAQKPGGHYYKGKSRKEPTPLFMTNPEAVKAQARLSPEKQAELDAKLAQYL